MSTSATDEPGSPGPRRADARRNHERILSGAREVFAAVGAEAQMDDVARRAGVGVGTVYRHFPTKEALMGELVRQKFVVFSQRARAALEIEGEPFEILAELLRGNCELAGRDMAVQHALMGAGPEVWALAGDAQAELVGLAGELMARARAAGTLRRDVGPEDLPMLMCGVSATMAHPGPGFDWHRHLELVIDALRAR